MPESVPDKNARVTARLSPHRRAALRRHVATGGDAHGHAARLLAAAGVGVPITSADPVPQPVIRAPAAKIVATRRPLPVRPAACVSLGSCPAGHRCGEQLRTCNAGHGTVRHLDQCQACADYQARAVRGKT